MLLSPQPRSVLRRRDTIFAVSPKRLSKFSAIAYPEGANPAIELEFGHTCQSGTTANLELKRSRPRRAGSWLQGETGTPIEPRCNPTSRNVGERGSASAVPTANGVMLVAFQHHSPPRPRLLHMSAACGACGGPTEATRPADAHGVESSGTGAWLVRGTTGAGGGVDGGAGVDGGNKSENGSSVGIGGGVNTVGGIGAGVGANGANVIVGGGVTTTVCGGGAGAVTVCWGGAGGTSVTVA